jgi:hypothetical protein
MYIVHIWIYFSFGKFRKEGFDKFLPIFIIKVENQSFLKFKKKGGVKVG